MGSAARPAYWKSSGDLPLDAIAATFLGFVECIVGALQGFANMFSARHRGNPDRCRADAGREPEPGGNPMTRRAQIFGGAIGFRIVGDGEEHGEFLAAQPRGEMPFAGKAAENIAT